MRRDLRYSWVGLESFFAAHSLHYACQDHTALLADGRVLVTGGDGSDALRRTEIYDPIQDEWALAEDLNVARTAHTATLRTNGRVLVVGGSAALAGSGELFNPATRLWAVSYLTSTELFEPAIAAWLAATPLAFMALASFNETGYTSRPAGGILPGLALLTVFVNGIPGNSIGVNIQQHLRIDLLWRF
jgi:hypothetical protein